jgi:hypothetical protein
MKISDETVRNQTPTLRRVEECLTYLRYGVINCTKGKEISCLLYNQICITVFTVSDISLCVTLDIYSSFHNITQL